jgi:hypothetical protein
MSLLNINGNDILVNSVEIYGSGIVQTTAQTGGVAPPVTTGVFSSYTNTTVGSPAVNPAFIASQNVYGGGGFAYLVSLDFGIEAQSALAPVGVVCSLNISSPTVGLEQLNLGIKTNQLTAPFATAPYKWGDTITFLYYPNGVLGTLNTIEFGLVAVGYDPAETFEVIYNFNWIQLAN